MKLLRGFQQLSNISAGTAVAIGNFDGVHLGHQALLRALRSQASHLQLPMLVILFEPQPSEYFCGQQAPNRLSSLREKLKALHSCGVEYVYCIKFDHRIATMPAREFASHYIFSLLHAKFLLIGEDFRFGHDRVGDGSLLRELGSQYSCIVQSFPDFAMDRHRVSSTKIRQALNVGEMDEAAKLLGRTYSMCGRVIHGAGLGRQWGIPTANLNIRQSSLPLRGVFSVKVKRQGKPSSMGVANIGCRPTIDGSRNSLEIHLFDVDESLYGEVLQVFFLQKLRDEKKFDSVDALIAQIHKDVALAKAYCAQIV